MDGGHIRIFKRKRHSAGERGAWRVLSQVESVECVEPDSPRALFARDHDGPLDPSVLFFVRSAGVAGTELGSLVRHDVLDGGTLFAASSKASRDLFVWALQTHTSLLGLAPHSPLAQQAAGLKHADAPKSLVWRMRRITTMHADDDVEIVE